MLDHLIIVYPILGNPHFSSRLQGEPLHTLDSAFSPLVYFSSDTSWALSSHNLSPVNCIWEACVKTGRPLHILFSDVLPTNGPIWRLCPPLHSTVASHQTFSPAQQGQINAKGIICLFAPGFSKITLKSLQGGIACRQCSINTSLLHQNVRRKGGDFIAYFLVLPKVWTFVERSAQ